MFRWTSGMGVDFSPIFQSSKYTTMDEAFSLIIKVVHLTPQRDFQIFAPLRTGNLSEVMDMIDDHRGTCEFHGTKFYTSSSCDSVYLFTTSSF